MALIHPGLIHPGLINAGLINAGLINAGWPSPADNLAALQAAETVIPGFR